MLSAQGPINLQCLQILLCAAGVAMLMLLSSPGSATGWSDYVLDIGDGYEIQRTSSGNVKVARNGRAFHLGQHLYFDVGPITGYIMTPQHIFTKNQPISRRISIPGDAAKNYVPPQECFFVISKETDSAVGPLSESAFMAQPEVVALDSLNWKRPTNPNFWLPVGGFLMLCSFFCRKHGYRVPVDHYPRLAWHHLVQRCLG